jgi:hypothetical protein
VSGIAHNSDELKSRTLRGGLAKVVAQGAALLLRVAASAGLARCPRDFCSMPWEYSTQHCCSAG